MVVLMLTTVPDAATAEALATGALATTALGYVDTSEYYAYDPDKAEKLLDEAGWTLGSGSFATTTVPSMRMTIDLADLDASRWNHLTGTSGHAFHPNYYDQFDSWQHQRQTPWLFTRERVEASAVDTLVLTPAG